MKGLASRVRGLLLCGVAVAATLGVARADGIGNRSRVQRIANATTELDVNRAQKLLNEANSDSRSLAFERARLAVYLGDCQTAAAILAGPSFSGEEQAADLVELTKTCSGATAAGLVVEDKKQGVWIRLQDERDRVLVPIIVDVAVKARATMVRDLGVVMPRPLRIDLVRDLFSLAAVTGLPVTAAETTGTIAVARWGRVTMLSPRAVSHGYPWQDTLAHEVTHLALSRATRDNAPLWLQEGIAKREESRWRKPEPFDRPGRYDRIAADALRDGRSVGVDAIGASIALLPTPEAAGIAFAEVTSFMAYWIERNGVAALRLLLADLKGLARGETDQAMISVTGFPLRYWTALWKKDRLAKLKPDAPQADAEKGKKGKKPKTPTKNARQRAVDERELARRVRLGDLLHATGHAPQAATQLLRVLNVAPREPAVVARLARAHVDAGDLGLAAKLVESTDSVRSSHGAWMALHGRFLLQSRQAENADRAFRMGVAIDPLSETVACEGYWRPGGRDPAPTAGKPHLPKDPARRALCEAARSAHDL